MIDRAILIAWIETVNIWRSSSESNYKQYSDDTDNWNSADMERKGIKTRKGNPQSNPLSFYFKIFWSPYAYISSTIATAN